MTKKSGGQEICSSLKKFVHGCGFLLLFIGYKLSAALHRAWNAAGTSPDDTSSLVWLGPEVAWHHNLLVGVANLSLISVISGVHRLLGFVFHARLVFFNQLLDVVVRVRFGLVSFAHTRGCHDHVTHLSVDGQRTLLLHNSVCTSVSSCQVTSFMRLNRSRLQFAWLESSHIDAIGNRDRRLVAHSTFLHACTSVGPSADVGVFSGAFLGVVHRPHKALRVDGL